MSELAEANTDALYLNNRGDDALHMLAVQVHKLTTLELGTHALLYINKKLQIVNLASKIISKGTEEAENWL